MTDAATWTEEKGLTVVFRFLARLLVQGLVRELLEGKTKRQDLSVMASLIRVRDKDTLDGVITLLKQEAGDQWEKARLYKPERQEIMWRIFDEEFAAFI